MIDVLPARQVRQRHRLAVAILAFFASPAFAPAAETLQTGEFLNRVYRDEQGDHKYVVFLPRNYADDKPWPLVVWLHGASARGKDGRAPLVSGIGPNIARRRDTFGFVVVFPQCETLQSRLLGGWTDERDDADRALKIVAEVERDFRIDPRRRVLAGVSMGAFGVWSVAARTPRLWSAIVPVSGGGPLSLAEALRDVPVWAFHAADDQVVPPSASRDLVQAVQSAGGRAHYTELPNGGHNIGSRVFAKDEVYEWMLDPHRAPHSPADWPLDITADLQLQDEVAFVPGAEVDHAVRVRIGADFLTSLAWALPGQVPADALQGSRGAQSELTGSRWMRFQVTVPGVHYSGRLSAARLELLPDNQVCIRLGLEPLHMTILGTDLQGRFLRAHAGPMQVVIGARRPAWLNVVIRPRIESRRLRLELVSAEFPMEPDNWYVTEPAGIDVRPLPLLRNRITQRITDGVYAKQAEISQQVVAGVPRLLEQIEQQTQQRLDRTVTFGRWPMPVWQPRAKFWPSEFIVNADGITVSLGATLAALAPQSPTAALKRYPGPKTVPPWSGEGVQIALATETVAAWTELLAASDVRFFHVQDFHAREFHKLADLDFLSQVIPGWNACQAPCEYRSVLSFEQPLELKPVEGDPAAIQMIGRELRLTISERKTSNDAWTPVAEFPLSWRQNLRVGVDKVGHRRRAVHIRSVAPPIVSSSGRMLAPSADEASLPNHRLVAEQFQRGWEATFATAMAKEIRLPERIIAEVPLVCEDVGITPDHLLIRMAKPVTQIRNVSRDPVVYEVRVPNGTWSEPHTLPPGMMHEFAAATPLTWRYRTADREFRFTLPIGSVSRFRGGVETPLTLVPDASTPPLAGQPQTDLR